MSVTNFNSRRRTIVKNSCIIDKFEFNMKNITWLLLLPALCIFDVICNDNILSKFHQNSYKFKDVRAELTSCSKKYFKFCEIKTFKYNRTTPAINVTFNMKISVQDKIEVVVQAYKFLSNENRHFPMRFQLNAKKSVDSNAIGLKNTKNCGNTTTFDFEKDITYHICNFVIDETHSPPLIPNGRFKMGLTLLYLNEEIALIDVFSEVYTPMKYPKK